MVTMMTTPSAVYMCIVFKTLVYATQARMALHQADTGTLHRHRRSFPLWTVVWIANALLGMTYVCEEATFYLGNHGGQHITIRGDGRGLLPLTLSVLYIAWNFCKRCLASLLILVFRPSTKTKKIYSETDVTQCNDYFGSGFEPTDDDTDLVSKRLLYEDARKCV